MKYLLVLLVVAIGVWLLLRGRGRSEAKRGSDDGGPATPNRTTTAPAHPTEMVACSHCGLHLPSHETHRDAAGRRFCSVEHRDAGPR